MPSTAGSLCASGCNEAMTDHGFGEAVTDNSENYIINVGSFGRFLP